MGRPRFRRGIGGGGTTTCLGRPGFRGGSGGRAITCLGRPAVRGGSGWGGVITFLGRPRFRFSLGSLVVVTCGTVSAGSLRGRPGLRLVSGGGSAGASVGI